MSEFDNINDSVLATYVDEYCRRAINEVRRYEELNNQTINIGIAAIQYRSDGEYTIKHKIQVGDTYDNNGIHASVTSDNLVRGAHLCVMRLVTDLQTPPKSYSAMLPAPEEPLTQVESDPFDSIKQEDIDADAAEFHPIEDQGEEQVSSDTGSGTTTASRDEDDD